MSIARFCAECGASLEQRTSPEPASARRYRRGRERTVVAVLVLLFGGTLLALVGLSLADLPSWLYLVVWIAIEGAITCAAFVLLRRVDLQQMVRWTAPFRECLIAVGAGLVTCAFSVVLVGAMQAVAGSSAASELDATAVLAAIVVAPVLEEWMCRGILWQALFPFTAARARVLAAAVLFGLLHCLEGLTGFGHRFVAGLAFGWLRERSGSLLPPVLAHATHNVACVLYGWWSFA